MELYEKNVNLDICYPGNFRRKWPHTLESYDSNSDIMGAFVVNKFTNTQFRIEIHLNSTRMDGVI